VAWGQAGQGHTALDTAGEAAAAVEAGGPDARTARVDQVIGAVKGFSSPCAFGLMQNRFRKLSGEGYDAIA
jgi:hypothetical protein